MFKLKPWMYILIVLALVVAGFAAYFAGRYVRPKVIPLSSELHGTAWQNPPSVAEVALRKADGTTLSFTDLSKDINVVFFGFTRCPDVCPLTLAKLAEMFRNLEEPENLDVFMITVDPEYDTPEVTQSYVSNFHPRFIGLSGDNSQVTKALERFFVAGQESGEGNFVHTDAVLILDKKANLRYVYGQFGLIHLEGDLKQLLGRKDW